MNKRLQLILILFAVGISIFWLSKPETIVEEQTGQEITLGPVGPRVSADIGNTVQDFVLGDYDDQIVSFEDYRGKAVVLNFWATWCPFCIEEMPLFNELYSEFESQGLEIIAVNRGESLDQAKKFTDPMNLKYKLLLDKADEVYNAYNLQAMPTTFFVDANGVIQHIKFGAISEEELRQRIETLLGQSPEAETEILSETASETSSITSPKTSVRNVQITDGTKHSVPLTDIKGGGPPKDGIPSIDNPKFTTVTEADEFLQDEGIGISLSHNGVERFYPHQITVWHEIVNDEIDGKAFLVTYCPLCGTGIVFDPTIAGKSVEFGTSGKLWNSNLVMYDRETDSYWSQVLGEAIVGELTGMKLDLLPHDNVRWKDWKAAYPEGQVLSRETGHFRDYLSGGPYGNYDTNDTVIFPVDNEDARYHPKEPTWGIEIDGQFKAYPQVELRTGLNSFSDSFAGQSLKIEFDKQNNTIAIEDSSGEEVVPSYGFWFSWIAVHEESEVYSAK
jgi:peroxiredoxin